MKSIVRHMCLITAILVLSSVAAAQKEGKPSTKEERDTVVKVAHILEADPLNKDAKKMREWAVSWVIQVNDIHITICSSYLELVGSKKPYETELFGQEIISMSAFIVEHPDQSSDEVAVHQAGVEGALRAYESILKTKPKAKIEYLDDLISKRDKGELKAYVENVAKTKCTKKI